MPYFSHLKQQPSVAVLTLHLNQLKPAKKQDEFNLVEGFLVHDIVDGKAVIIDCNSKCAVVGLPSNFPEVKGAVIKLQNGKYTYLRRSKAVVEGEVNKVPLQTIVPYWNLPAFEFTNIKEEALNNIETEQYEILTDSNLPDVINLAYSETDASGTYLVGTAKFNGKETLFLSFRDNDKLSGFTNTTLEKQADGSYAILNHEVKLSGEPLEKSKLALSEFKKLISTGKEAINAVMSTKNHNIIKFISNTKELYTLLVNAITYNKNVEISTIVDAFSVHPNLMTDIINLQKSVGRPFNHHIIKKIKAAKVISDEKKQISQSLGNVVEEERPKINFGNKPEYDINSHKNIPVNDMMKALDTLISAAKNMNKNEDEASKAINNQFIPPKAKVEDASKMIYHGNRGEEFLATQDSFYREFEGKPIHIKINQARRSFNQSDLLQIIDDIKSKMPEISTEVLDKISSDNTNYRLFNGLIGLSEKKEIASKMETPKRTPLDYTEIANSIIAKESAENKSDKPLIVPATVIPEIDKEKVIKLADTMNKIVNGTATSEELKAALKPLKDLAPILGEASADLAKKIESGLNENVSMGCKVSEASSKNYYLQDLCRLLFLTEESENRTSKIKEILDATNPKVDLQDLLKFATFIKLETISNYNNPFKYVSEPQTQPVKASTIELINKIFPIGIPDNYKKSIVEFNKGITAKPSFITPLYSTLFNNNGTPYEVASTVKALNLDVNPDRLYEVIEAAKILISHYFISSYDYTPAEVEKYLIGHIKLLPPTYKKEIDLVSGMFPEGVPIELAKEVSENKDYKITNSDFAALLKTIERKKLLHTRITYDALYKLLFLTGKSNGRNEEVSKVLKELGLETDSSALILFASQLKFKIANLGPEYIWKGKDSLNESINEIFGIYISSPGTDSKSIIGIIKQLLPDGIQQDNAKQIIDAVEKERAFESALKYELFTSCETLDDVAAIVEARNLDANPEHLFELITASKPLITDLYNRMVTYQPVRMSAYVLARLKLSHPTFEKEINLISDQFRAGMPIELAERIVGKENIARLSDVTLYSLLFLDKGTFGRYSKVKEILQNLGLKTDPSELITVAERLKEEIIATVSRESESNWNGVDVFNRIIEGMVGKATADHDSVIGIIKQIFGTTIEYSTARQILAAQSLAGSKPERLTALDEFLNSHLIKNQKIKENMTNKNNKPVETIPTVYAGKINEETHKIYDRTYGAMIDESSKNYGGIMSEQILAGLQISKETLNAFNELIEAAKNPANKATKEQFEELTNLYKTMINESNEGEQAAKEKKMENLLKEYMEDGKHVTSLEFKVFIRSKGMDVTQDEVRNFLNSQHRLGVLSLYSKTYRTTATGQRYNVYEAPQDGKPVEGIDMNALKEALEKIDLKNNKKEMEEKAALMQEIVELKIKKDELENNPPSGSETAIPVYADPIPVTALETPKPMSTFDQTKQIFTEASWRIAAKKSSATVKNVLLTTIKDGHPLKSVLESDYGTALIMAVMGLALPYINKDARIIKLSEEMQIGSVEMVMGEVVDIVTDLIKSLLISPDLTSFISSLPEAEPVVVAKTEANKV